MLERRVDKDHEYYRLECGYLPGTHETAQKLRDVTDQIDWVIGYNEPVFTCSAGAKVFSEKTNLAEILL